MFIKVISILFAIIYAVHSLPADLAADDISYLGASVFGTPSEATGRRLAKWTPAEGTNPEEQGEYAEGDILFTSKGRNALVAETSKWPGGEVPYEINGVFTGKDRSVIADAIAAFDQYTCIKFRPRTSADPDWLSIVSGNSGCWSSVGRIGGKQDLNLQSPGCLYKVGTAIHEMLHALGFVHEQNRWERDDFVRINYGNIQAGRQGNFEKAKEGTTNGHGVDYDFLSVLHYSGKAFSVNGQPTIEPVTNAQGQQSSNNGLMQQLAGLIGWDSDTHSSQKGASQEMGQREGFSQGDLIKLRRMYCSSREVRH